MPPVCAPLPGLAEVWTDDCVFIRVMQKVSSKGFRQERVVMLRSGGLLVADGTKSGKWRVSRVVKYTEVEGLFLEPQKKMVLVKVRGSFDLLMVFSENKQNPKGDGAAQFVSILRDIFEDTCQPLPVTLVPEHENIKTFAKLQKTKAFESPTKVISRKVRQSSKPTTTTSSPQLTTILMHKTPGDTIGIILAENLTITGYEKWCPLDEHDKSRLLGKKLASVASVSVDRPEDPREIGIDCSVCTIGVLVDEPLQGEEEEKSQQLQALVQENEYLKSMLQFSFEGSHGHTTEVSSLKSEISELKELSIRLGDKLQEARPATTSTATNTDVQTPEAVSAPDAAPAPISAPAPVSDRHHEKCEYRLRIVQKEKQNLREAIAALKQQIVVLQTRLSNVPTRLE